MHIKSIDLIDYRSCKRATFKPNADLSALVGANGSGKTNILNGVLLIKRIARLNRGTREDESILSGCKVKYVFDLNQREIKYEALVKFAVNERNTDDVVAADQKWNFESITGDNKWVKLPLTIFDELRLLREFDFSAKHEQDYFADRLASFSRSVGIDPRFLDSIRAITQEVEMFARGITYYGASQFTDPSKCPNSFEIEVDRPSKRRSLRDSEHVQFMYDLYAASKPATETYLEFKSLVCKDGIALIDDLEFQEVDVPSNIYQVFTGGRLLQREVRKKLVIPNFLVKGARLSPNQLSEGTFKTLALMFYTITDKSKLFILEEPEVCVHHGLLNSTIEILKSISRRKQIMVSTHSDYVLDALDPTQVFVVRYDVGKGTTVKSIPTALSKRDYSALKKYLDTTGNLGEYWRQGDLEQ